MRGVEELCAARLGGWAQWLIDCSMWIVVYDGSFEYIVVEFINWFLRRDTRHRSRSRGR